MFDWEDQELANIIWGEAAEADDHVVPYTEEVEKRPLPVIVDHGKWELDGQAANIKAAESEIHVTKTNSNGGTTKSNNNLSAAGVFMDSQLLSSLTASKTDRNAIVKKVELPDCSENSQNQHEDKELRELVDCTWANIGSFDDLDRIFSNNDLVGHPSLGSTEELWSSRDVLSDTEQSSSLDLDSTNWELGALGNTSGHYEIDPEYLQDENPLFTPGYAGIDSTSYAQKRFCASMGQGENAVHSSHLINEKIKVEPHLAAETIATPKKSSDKNWSKNKSRHGHKADKISDHILPAGMYRSWPLPAVHVQQFDSQCAPAIVQNCPSSGLGLQRLPMESGSLVCHHFSNPYAAHHAYGNFTKQHMAMALLQPTNNELQSGLSSSEACPGDLDSLNKSSESSARTLNMTPQEKIEKLRRRQQIRAMLAIQRQQQQLSHQVPAADYSIPLKSPQEDKILNMERITIPLEENLGVPCGDLNSPIKWDDSRITSVEVDGHTVEDTVLYQLQDVIDKLDIKIRLCIRDSLFRLAHSAMQRHHASDMGSTNRTSTSAPHASKEEISSHDRCAGVPNVETETNLIDRCVAHLLFHQPCEFSGKTIETLESSTSTKISLEPETDLSSLPLGFFMVKSTENEPNLSPKESNFGHSFLEHHQEDIEEISGADMTMNQGMEETMRELVD